MSYNREIIRELLRQTLKRLKKDKNYVIFKEQGKEIKIDTSEIFYIKAAGNYIEICTTTKNYTIRKKMSEFDSIVPDPIEFLRVNRSYIVRIDKVAAKNAKFLVINEHEIPIGTSYKEAVKAIIF